jgi:hypothetical protein
MKAQYEFYRLGVLREDLSVGDGIPTDPLTLFLGVYRFTFLPRLLASSDVSRARPQVTMVTLICACDRVRHPT